MYNTDKQQISIHIKFDNKIIFMNMGLHFKLNRLQKHHRNLLPWTISYSDFANFI